MVIPFMTMNQSGSVLTIFTFKGQKSEFQISLDYSPKLFGHFLIGKITRRQKLVIFIPSR